MEFEEYTKSAIRTESTIDELKINGRLLVHTLSLFISAGQMLDQIKKNTFYGKAYTPAIHDAYETAVRDLEVIHDAPLQYEKEKYEFVDPRVFHSIIGIATESTELCEALLHTLTTGEDLDVVNILEENGDINWYQAIMMDACGGDWGDILENNIEKLKERFPEKFTNEDALNRDLDAERAILEKMKD